MYVSNAIYDATAPEICNLLEGGNRSNPTRVDIHYVDGKYGTHIVPVSWTGRRTRCFKLDGREHRGRVLTVRPARGVDG